DAAGGKADPRHGEGARHDRGAGQARRAARRAADEEIRRGRGSGRARRVSRQRRRGVDYRRAAVDRRRLDGAMTPERVDAIVIGVGQAAPALCARLDKEGLKTVLIERKVLGGTCVNNGCVPTKTMIASARAAHMARRGGEYGFAASQARIDMAGVKRRKDRVVRDSVKGL